jgi:hypothetical protein
MKPSLLKIVWWQMTCRTIVGGNCPGIVLEYYGSRITARVSNFALSKFCSSYFLFQADNTITGDGQVVTDFEEEVKSYRPARKGRRNIQFLNYVSTGTRDLAALYFIQSERLCLVPDPPYLTYPLIDKGCHLVSLPSFSLFTHGNIMC